MSARTARERKLISARESLDVVDVATDYRESANEKSANPRVLSGSKDHNVIRQID